MRTALLDLYNFGQFALAETVARLPSATLRRAAIDALAYAAYRLSHEKRRLIERNCCLCLRGRDRAERDPPHRHRLLLRILAGDGGMGAGRRRPAAGSRDRDPWPRAFAASSGARQGRDPVGEQRFQPPRAGETDAAHPRHQAASNRPISA